MRGVWVGLAFALPIDAALGYVSYTLSHLV